MATLSTSEIVWVRWEGNNSRRHDGTVSGVHKDSLVHGAGDAEGDKVDVLWGCARGGSKHVHPLAIASESHQL